LKFGLTFRYKSEQNEPKTALPGQKLALSVTNDQKNRFNFYIIR